MINVNVIVSLSIFNLFSLNQNWCLVTINVK